MDKSKIGNVGIALVKCNDTLSRLVGAKWSLVSFYYKSSMSGNKMKVSTFFSQFPNSVSWLGDSLNSLESLFNNTVVTKLGVYPIQPEFNDRFRSLLVEELLKYKDQPSSGFTIANRIITNMNKITLSVTPSDHLLESKCFTDPFEFENERKTTLEDQKLFDINCKDLIFNLVAFNRLNTMTTINVSNTLMQKIIHMKDILVKVNEASDDPCLFPLTDMIDIFNQIHGSTVGHIDVKSSGSRCIIPNINECSLKFRDTIVTINSDLSQLSTDELVNILIYIDSLGNSNWNYIQNRVSDEITERSNQ